MRVRTWSESEERHAPRCCAIGLMETRRPRQRGEQVMELDIRRARPAQSLDRGVANEAPTESPLARGLVSESRHKRDGPSVYASPADTARQDVAPVNRSKAEVQRPTSRSRTPPCATAHETQSLPAPSCVASQAPSTRCPSSGRPASSRRWATTCANPKAPSQKSGEPLTSLPTIRCANAVCSMGSPFAPAGPEIAPNTVFRLAKAAVRKGPDGVPDRLKSGRSVAD